MTNRKAVDGFINGFMKGLIVLLALGVSAAAIYGLFKRSNQPKQCAPPSWLAVTPNSTSESELYCKLPSKQPYERSYYCYKEQGPSGDSRNCAPVYCRAAGCRYDPMSYDYSTVGGVERDPKLFDAPVRKVTCAQLRQIMTAPGRMVSGLPAGFTTKGECQISLPPTAVDKILDKLVADSM